MKFDVYASLSDSRGVSQASLDAVRKCIYENNGALRVADIVHDTGLSIYEIEDTLEAIIGEYDVRIDVNDDAELVYHFLDVEHPDRYKSPQAESALKVLGDNILEAGKLVFKGLMVITTFTYFLAGIPFMLLLGLLLLPSLFILTLYTLIKSQIVGLLLLIAEVAFIFYLRNSLKRKTNTSKKFLSLFNSAYVVFMPASRPMPKPTKRNTRWESPFRLLFSSRTIQPFPKPAPFFLDAYFHYVFGKPKAQENNETELNARILQYLKLNHYQITVAELIALTGWDLNTAEVGITKLMVRYHGKPKATEKGTLVYHFDHLASEDVALPHHVNELFIWNNPLPHKPPNDNTKGQNYSIFFLHVFMLILPVAYLAIDAVLSGEISKVLSQLFAALPAILLVGFPLFYAITAIALSLGTRSRVAAENRNRSRMNQFREGLKQVFTQSKPILYNRRDQVHRELLEKLNGDVHLNDQNEQTVTFTLIWNEWAERKPINDHRNQDTEQPLAISQPPLQQEGVLDFMQDAEDLKIACRVKGYSFSRVFSGFLISLVATSILTVVGFFFFNPAIIGITLLALLAWGFYTFNRMMKSLSNQLHIETNGYELKVYDAYNVMPKEAYHHLDLDEIKRFGTASIKVPDGAKMKGKKPKDPLVSAISQLGLPKDDGSCHVVVYHLHDETKPRPLIWYDMDQEKATTIAWLLQGYLSNHLVKTT